MIKASDYQASVPITVPEPTAHDLEIREAAADMGRDHRFSGRALCREFGLEIEPKTTIHIGHGFGGGIGFSEAHTFGGGRLDELLPGEAEWIAAAAERKARP